jgi:putative two-component system response regulator
LTESSEVDTAVAEFRPDIVLLDLHMPNPDGFEIMRRLRQASPEFLPIIVLTADESKTARDRALIGGADDFLIKPLDRQEVVLRVRNLLRTRELYVELAEANEALQRKLARG